MYRLEQFRDLGLYTEKPVTDSIDFTVGKVIPHPQVSEKMKLMLREIGGASYNGDYNRQDSAVITALLSAGISPSDSYATFAASNRGKHAAKRKPGHLDDYIRRTIESSLSYIKIQAPIIKLESIKVDFSKRKSHTSESGLIISMANEIETEKTQWLWPGYLPAGKLTILAGDPGMGKSTIAVDIISRISKGTFLPSGKRSVTGTSLVASAEDAPEDTITPRLIASEANLSKIGIIREVRDSVDENESRYLSLPRDLALLRQALIKKGCRVLVIDPLNAFLEKGTDTYKDQDMRLVLHPLEAIAEETGTAIFVVAHLNKKEDTSTLYRVGGSIGFIGAARSVLAVTRMNDETRVLYSLKSNLSARPASLSYEIKQVRKQRKNGEWLGEEVINSSSIRWLGEVEFNPFSKTPDMPEGKVSEEAHDFLKQVLQDAGEMDTEQLYREARLAGISKTHINKVKVSLGIKSTKRDGKWIWSWPEEQVK